MSVIAELHVRMVEKDVELARRYREVVLLKMQLAEFRKHGALMELKPGWRRPRIVRVLSWDNPGDQFCLVKCVVTSRDYVFPRHQLHRPCWRCRGKRSVFAFKSRKAFPCPACSWRRRYYPKTLRVMMGQEGPVE